MSNKAQELYEKELAKKTASKPKKPRVQKKGERAPKFVCRKCGKHQSINNFYDTTSPEIDTNGKLSICKECIRNDFLKLYYESDKNLEKSIFEMCKKVDLIFDDGMYQTFFDQIEEQRRRGTVDEDKNLFSRYKSIVHRVQGNDENVCGIRFVDSPMFSEKSAKKLSEIKSREVSQEIIDRFGEGFDDEQYIAFQRKWDELSPSFNHASKLHTEAFTRYIILSVQESNLLALGEWDKAKKLSDMVTKAASDAKITPKLMSAADLQGGLDSFGDLSLAVEKVNEISPILPKHRFQPNDALDFILWRYINAVEDIKGVPHSSYEDMYKFYDKRVEEYIEDFGDPFGMFDDDPTVKNRENVKKFIKKAGV